MAFAIETSGLSKSFGAVRALDGVDLQVREGEIFGLVGPDGAGKTTLIRLLSGIMRPHAGSATVLGTDVVADPETVKGQLGYMSQRFSLYQDLSVEENILFFQDLYRVPRPDRAERMRRLLEFSRLGPFRDRPAGKLSGGMKQKLGLCCALIHTPKILFLDEPTTGVDPISRRELWSLLYDLWHTGLTIVVSTPYMDEAERCTRIGFMEKGRIIRTGAPAQIIAEFPSEMAELASAQARPLVERIAALPSVRAVHPYGDRLHIAVSSYEQAAPAIENVARASGATFALRRIRPSLEDVFLQLGEG
jgi:ABC-2 type transport system ATP-binding protein